MRSKKAFKIIYTGLLAGFVSEAVLGGLFMSPPVQFALYNPEWQSDLFIEITFNRDLVKSIIGLIILSIAHSWLYDLFKPSIPGHNWLKKGLFWGFTIWLMYWVFQEWFIYHTLLKEPLLLNILELTILLIGSIVEGLIIAKLLNQQNGEKKIHA
ncbi:MAG: hypothetical protein WEC59_04985 [Salibacteraceae bacterium]